MVNQYGDHAVCIGTVNGDVYMNSSDNSDVKNGLYPPTQNGDIRSLFLC